MRNDERLTCGLRGSVRIRWGRWYTLKWYVRTEPWECRTLLQSGTPPRRAYLQSVTHHRRRSRHQSRRQNGRGHTGDHGTKGRYHD